MFSQERKNWNHLGVEIRPTIVQAGLERLTKSGYDVTNPGTLNFLTCNFAHSGKSLFEGLPEGAVRLISIQFPDPWRRKKHRKRMLVQPELVSLLSDHMIAGSYIYLSTDSKQAMAWMLRCFKAPESKFSILSKDYDFSASNTNGAFVYCQARNDLLQKSKVELSGPGHLDQKIEEGCEDLSTGNGDEEDLAGRDDTEEDIDSVYGENFIRYNPLVYTRLYS